jgi:hypothetical protein
MFRNCQRKHFEIDKENILNLEIVFSLLSSSRFELNVLVACIPPQGPLFSVLFFL